MATLPANDIRRLDWADDPIVENFPEMHMFIELHSPDVIRPWTIERQCRDTVDDVNDYAFDGFLEKPMNLKKFRDLVDNSLAAG